MGRANTSFLEDSLGNPRAEFPRTKLLHLLQRSQYFTTVCGRLGRRWRVIRRAACFRALGYGGGHGCLVQSRLLPLILDRIDKASACDARPNRHSEPARELPTSTRAIRRVIQPPPRRTRCAIATPCAFMMMWKGWPSRLSSGAPGAAQ